jgi:sigma-B regulation protein RsbU (phosphoserine phosphatase)
MGAALIMATVKSRLPLLTAGRTVAETVAALNDSLVDELAAREFVALIYARYDAATGVLEIANAGLPDPYLVTAGRAPLSLVVPGERLPLGMRRRLEHRALRVELPPGSRILFLTDGVPEAPTAQGEPLGYEALVALLPDAAPLPGWLDGLVTAVEKRSPGARADDWTLLALERVTES